MTGSPFLAEYLSRYYYRNGTTFVIPRVTFIWCLGPILLSTFGSLSSAFATARLVGLAVKPAYAFALSLRFPSVASRP